MARTLDWSYEGYDAGKIAREKDYHPKSGCQSKPRHDSFFAPAPGDDKCPRAVLDTGAKVIKSGSDSRSCCQIIGKHLKVESETPRI